MELYLQFEAVVLHLEVHAGWSDIEGNPLPSVERHLQPRNRPTGDYITIQTVSVVQAAFSK